MQLNHLLYVSRLCHCVQIKFSIKYTISKQREAKTTMWILLRGSSCGLLDAKCRRCWWVWSHTLKSHEHTGRCAHVGFGEIFIHCSPSRTNEDANDLTSWIKLVWVFAAGRDVKESKQTLNPLSKETHTDTQRSSDSLLSPAHTHTHTHTHTHNWRESEWALTQHRGLIYM